MTLAIGLVNPEGIVMAADSRQSYRHAAVRIGSDSAIKVFELTDTVVAATSGYAFLRSQNAPSVQNISTLVEALKPTLVPHSTVQQVATALHAHFSTIYDQHIVHFPGEAVAAGGTAIQFIVRSTDLGLPDLCRSRQQLRRGRQVVQGVDDEIRAVGTQDCRSPSPCDDPARRSPPHTRAGRLLE